MTERDYTHTTKGCFGCGVENSAGLGLRPWREQEWVVAEFRPQAHHRGFSRVVHGGIIAAVLDEVITSAVAVATGDLLATVSLQVDFRSPMFLDGTYAVRCRRTEDQGSLHAGEGSIVDASGGLVARGRGTFLPLTKERIGRFLGDPA